MDPAEPTEIPTTDSTAEDSTNTITHLEDNATAVNASEEVEIPPPSEGSRTSASTAGASNKPNVVDANGADTLTSESDSTAQPAAITSKTAQVTESSVAESAAPPSVEAEDEPIEQPDISTLSAALTNEAPARIVEEIVAQTEAIQQLQNALDQPAAVADNMEIETIEAPITGEDNIRAQPQPEHRDTEHGGEADDGQIEPDISELASALITEAAALIDEEIDAQTEAMQQLENALEQPAAEADNMEIETNEGPLTEEENIMPQQQPEHGDNEHDGDGNADNVEIDEDGQRFNPALLIEPLLEDDDMGEQRLEIVDVDEGRQIYGDDMLEDISDDASSSSDAVFDDDQMRAAFREMLVQNRRGGENFMQRLRSAFFTMEHNRDRRRTEPENNEVEIEEPEPENPISFDTNLPAEHSYLGENMNRVSGVSYLEPGQEYNMMLFMHQHILFPGEVLPFMISGSIIDSDMNAQNGLVFGVCFPVLCNSEEAHESFYGVTCQIYEKGTDERGNTLVKSRALQRFVVKSSQVTGPLSYIAAHPQFKVYGIIRILPEIYLREPLKCIDMGSLNRFRDIESMSDTYKRYQAATTAWPAHVYDYYSITTIVEKARSQLAQHKIDTMPTDPTQLSFWLVRNLHLSDSLMKTIFLTDSVNMRMKLISNTFTDDSVFTCRYCGNRIANCQQLFAMSKHGVQTQYCNSAGYIHETNTVYQLLPDAITYSGQPSAEFSWFPGYEWHIIVCKICSRHIGWKFKALEPNLVPKTFFGISSSSVRISSPTAGNTNTRAAVFQSLMRLARREMQ